MAHSAVQQYQVSAIIWHECPSCGHGWPFPYATAPSSARDWRCHPCIEAAAGRAVRALRDLPRCEIMGLPGVLWVKATDLDAKLALL